MKPGTGATPQPTDRVEVHYTGQAARRHRVRHLAQAAASRSTFPLNGVIKCWTEGVGRMKVGEQAVLTCPADTAYGEGGQRNIPPGATLVFDVELVGIAEVIRSGSGAGVARDQQRDVVVAARGERGDRGEDRVADHGGRRGAVLFDRARSADRCRSARRRSSPASRLGEAVGVEHQQVARLQARACCRRSRR